jgi:AmiR/NasT family two-component response regulator
MITENEHQQRENGQPVTPGVDEGKKTILIYSRDLDFSLSLSAIFQDRFNVVTTTNPGLLETFVTHYAADLVIVDAEPLDRMLRKVGELKELNRHLPIIALYVYTSKDGQLDTAIRSHVDSVFYKPLEVGAISKRIEELFPT